MILTTKKYDVNTKDGCFSLYVSQHSDGSNFAGVLWYRKKGSWGKGEDVHLDFDLKSFANTSEEEAFNEAVAWVKDNLDTKAEIVEQKK